MFQSSHYKGIKIVFNYFLVITLDCKMQQKVDKWFISKIAVVLVESSYLSLFYVQRFNYLNVFFLFIDVPKL